MDVATSSSSGADDSELFDFDDSPSPEEVTFNSAASHVRSVADKLAQDDLLYLYGRYKLVTEGPCHSPKPGFFDFQGRKKWDAWNKCTSVAKSTAMEEYVEKVRSLNLGWDPNSTDSAKTRGSTFGMRMSRPAVICESEDELKKDIDSWISLVQKDLAWTEIDKWVGSNGSRVDVNQRDSEGLTALHWACDRGKADLVELLLDRGSEINSQATDGQTPLHYAASCSHDSVVKILLANGADAGVKDADGATPIELTDNPDLKSLLQC